MGDEEKIQRLGEWAEANINFYATTHTVYAPGDHLYGGSAAQISFRQQTITVIEPHRMVQLFKDYDKYLDSKLVL